MCRAYVRSTARPSEVRTVTLSFRKEVGRRRTQAGVDDHSVTLSDVAVDDVSESVGSHRVDNLGDMLSCRSADETLGDRRVAVDLAFSL